MLENMERNKAKEKLTQEQRERIQQRQQGLVEKKLSLLE